MSGASSDLTLSRRSLGRISKFRAGSVTPAEDIRCLNSTSFVLFPETDAQGVSGIDQGEPIADDEELKTSIDKFLDSVQAAAKGSKMTDCLPGKGLKIQQGKKKTLILETEFLDLILKLTSATSRQLQRLPGASRSAPQTVADKASGTAEAEEKLRKVPTPDAPPRYIGVRDKGPEVLPRSPCTQLDNSPV